MRTITSFFVLLLLALLPAADAADRPGVHTMLSLREAPPIGLDDFETQWAHLPSATFDPDSGYVIRGEFTGPDDLTVEFRALSDDRGFTFHVRVLDDQMRDADQLTLDLGPVTLRVRGDGTRSDASEDWDAAVTRTTGGWSFRVFVGPVIVNAIMAPPRDRPFNITIDDHDDTSGTPQGTLSWRETGDGILHVAEPMTDLLDAARALEALEAEFGPDRVVRKQVERLRSAVEEGLWIDRYTAADRRAVTRILTRIRKALRKLERHDGWGLVTIRPVFADVTVPAERAARVIALQFVRRAVLDAGPGLAARVVARFDNADQNRGRDPSWYVKQYRKAARKAAKLFR